MANLKHRVDKIEQRMRSKRHAILLYHEDDETLEQAKARYKQEHGVELPDDATIICYTTISPDEVNTQ